MTTPTSQLDAVNYMLASIQEAPVSSLEGTNVDDVATAVSALDRASRSVQKRGYRFNTEPDFEFTPDADGFINLPSSTLKVVIKRGRYTEDPVWRGTRLYDRKDGTYVFDRNIKADVTKMLDFEDMPESAREYIFTKAARVFQQQTIGDDDHYSFTARDEQISRAEFINDMQDGASNNMVSGPGMEWIATRRVR